jgi:PAS domain-containing protein
MFSSTTLAPARKPFSLDKSRKRFQFARHHLVLDVRGSLQALSPAARALLEYTPDQRVETNFFSHVHSRNQYRVMRDVASLLVFEKDGCEWLLRLRSGRGRWLWFQAAARCEQTDGEPRIGIVLEPMRIDA